MTTTLTNTAATQILIPETMHEQLAVLAAMKGQTIELYASRLAARLLRAALKSPHGTRWNYLARKAHK